MNNHKLPPKAHEIAARYLKAREKFEAATQVMDECRTAFAALYGTGHHDACTIYSVPEARVRGYRRRAYTAVRPRTIR
jgi:hypothetical protein